MRRKLLSNHYEKIVREVNDNLGGITLEDVKIIGRGHIKYMVYPDAEYMMEDLNCLELSVRATNGLRRAGYRSVSDVLKVVSCNDDLATVRQLGKKSIEEIMLGIFLYQYVSLAPEKREEYLKEMLKLNGISRTEKN